MKKFYIILWLLPVIIFPIFVNFLMSLSTQSWTPTLRSYGDNSDWISFFGNYTGGIIGALVALFIAKYQYKKHIETENYNRMVNQLPVINQIKYEVLKVKEEFLSLEEFRKTIKDKDSDLESYSIRELNKSRTTAFESLINIDLQTEVIKLIDFYDDFSYYVSYDLCRIKLKNAAMVQNAMFNDTLNNLDFVNDLKEYNYQVKSIEKNKKEMWRKYYTENYFNKTEFILNTINKEIRDIEGKRNLLT